MKATLTFEIDGKVEKIWSLDCGTDAINTFELRKMGYISETYLKDISKQFDPMIEIEDRITSISYAIDLLERLRGEDDNVIDNKNIELKEYLKELKNIVK
jgi:hypothetical protein